MTPIHAPITIYAEKNVLNMELTHLATKPININSPCINICVIDADTGFCFGCFRTIDEISDWQALTPEQKLDLLRELSDRGASDN